MLHLPLQDYSNALRVTVRGQATLKLITDKPTIKMESQIAMVCHESHYNNAADNSNKSFNVKHRCFL